MKEHLKYHFGKAVYNHPFLTTVAVASMSTTAVFNTAEKIVSEPMGTEGGIHQVEQVNSLNKSLEDIQKKYSELALAKLKADAKAKKSELTQPERTNINNQEIALWTSIENINYKAITSSDISDTDYKNIVTKINGIDVPDRYQLASHGFEFFDVAKRDIKKSDYTGLNAKRDLIKDYNTIKNDMFGDMAFGVMFPTLLVFLVTMSLAKDASQSDTMRKWKNSKPVRRRKKKLTLRND